MAIRTGGVAALGLAWFGGHELWRLHGTDPLGPLMFLLALITFLAASAGSAMLIVGPHLLDEVEISRRWARRPVIHESDPGNDHDFRP